MKLLRIQDRHINRNLEAPGKSTFRQRLIWIDPPSNRITLFLDVAGFLNASRIRQFRIIPELICGLIERWRPETHTFHMPCEECTITLEDVAFQLGVPISGPPIIAQNKEAIEITCFRYLGKVPDKTNIDGKHVKLTWLKSAFELNGNSSDKDVNCVARAYIFLLIGGMLMPDKSSAMMCKESKMSNVDGRELNADIGGCMVLLQSWAWYKMPFLALICAAPSEFPLATRKESINSKPILTTQAELEAWLLIFPSSGLRRGSRGSGSTSSAVGGSSRRRGSGAGGRGRQARQGTTEPEPKPEYALQMEEADVQFDTGLYPLSEPQFFDPQPVDVDYMTSVMGTTSSSSPLVSTGAGPSMFRTP
ncbi:hypothetical protein GQ457_06G009660 [Hibiscus cannabinus]